MKLTRVLLETSRTGRNYRKHMALLREREKALNDSADAFRKVRFAFTHIRQKPGETNAAFASREVELLAQQRAASDRVLQAEMALEEVERAAGIRPLPPKKGETRVRPSVLQRLPRFR
jgi:hypothetical protein